MINNPGFLSAFSISGIADIKNILGQLEKKISRGVRVLLQMNWIFFTVGKRFMNAKIEMSLIKNLRRRKNLKANLNTTESTAVKLITTSQLLITGA